MKIFKRDYMTVGELIEELQKHPKDFLVGVKGHFGEFYQIDKNDFWETKAWITESNRWRDEGEKKEFNILQISFPDIGPDPD